MAMKTHQLAADAFGGGIELLVGLAGLGFGHICTLPVQGFAMGAPDNQADPAMKPLTGRCRSGRPTSSTSGWPLHSRPICRAAGFRR